jgi:hypothetical protein
MKTTDTVEEPGLYSTECCNVETAFNTGDTFSRCPQCHSLCAWELDDEFVSAGDMPGPNGIAA